MLDAGEIEPLAAREDRDRNLVRLGRGEDELHMLGRLFERLQQRVERLLREHVDFVDDVDLEPRPARPHGDVLPQLANFIDAAVAGAVDLQHVDVVAGRHAAADVALVARRRRRALHAVERLGENPRGRRLADAAGTGEQIGVPDAVAGDRLLERPGDVLLADQLVERLRPIAAGDDDVLAAGCVARDQTLAAASLMASQAEVASAGGWHANDSQYRFGRR